MNKRNESDQYFYFSRLPFMTAREAALAMFGLDYKLEDKELAQKQYDDVNELKNVIARNLKTIFIDDNSVPTNKKYQSHLVLSAAWVFMRDGVTPDEVRKIINNAIMKLSQEKGGETKLKQMGGDDLYAIGKAFRHQKRGLHRRDDEDRNNWKLMALLVELLQKKCSSNYKELSVIYNDLVLLCRDKNIELDGMKKSTFYKKIKDAKNLMEL